MKKNFSYTATGNRIKLLRGDGQTQKQFAALLGISLRTYQRYEHGERLPPFKMLSKISNICDVSTDWVISGSGVKGKKLNSDDFIDAINKLDYLFDHGSFELIDFFKKILNFASNVAHSGLDTEAGEDLMEFLTFLTDMSSSALRKAFDMRDIISYKYRKNGKLVSVAYKLKNKKTEKKTPK
jgi:transcriptional regulator with XRE-family HTH domain